MCLIFCCFRYQQEDECFYYRSTEQWTHCIESVSRTRLKSTNGNPSNSPPLLLSTSIDNYFLDFSKVDVVFRCHSYPTFLATKKNNRNGGADRIESFSFSISSHLLSDRAFGKGGAWGSCLPTDSHLSGTVAAVS